MKRFYFIFLLLFISGCLNSIRPTVNTVLSNDHICYKNFEIGKKLEANIGEPVLKVTDYTISEYKPLFMRASSAFKIKGGIIIIPGDAKTFYPVLGELSHDDQIYTVLALSGHELFFENKKKALRVLIKQDGSVHGKVFLGRPWIFIIYSFTPTPPDLRFIPLKREIVNKDKPYLNFDFIYGGIHDNHLIFTYREFSQDDLKTPAFFLNMSYELGKKIIHFRNIKIAVHSATNERIEYTVLSDEFLDKLNNRLKPTSLSIPETLHPSYH